ncbi:hypothetical protein PoB_004765500 [Plakobranchus ocellatus]|uniref:Uncharacterized protein n=1 Tax=Plakobranchus ocellatus TaxID=259542 RepID=A0AAV4BPX6_9GAST|nr:hypothetical protein PoB_004765500 [Plakobranchus ocellatus]
MRGFGAGRGCGRKDSVLEDDKEKPAEKDYPTPRQNDNDMVYIQGQIAKPLNIFRTQEETASPICDSRRNHNMVISQC